jgi:hypothetical protein
MDTGAFPRQEVVVDASSICTFVSVFYSSGSHLHHLPAGIRGSSLLYRTFPHPFIKTNQRHFAGVQRVSEEFPRVLYPILGKTQQRPFSVDFEGRGNWRGGKLLFLGICGILERFTQVTVVGGSIACRPPTFLRSHPRLPSQVPRRKSLKISFQLCIHLQELFLLTVLG